MVHVTIYGIHTWIRHGIMKITTGWWFQPIPKESCSSHEKVDEDHHPILMYFVDPPGAGEMQSTGNSWQSCRSCNIKLKKKTAHKRGTLIFNLSLFDT